LEGLETMSLTPTSRQTIVVMILVILFLPLPAVAVTTDTSRQVSPAIIAPSLANLMSSTPQDERIPVVFQFPDGTTPELMKYLVERFGGEDIQVRHVFHIIPMVSAYAKRASINKLAVSGFITAVTLDTEARVTSVESQTPPIPMGNNKYVHPDVILGAIDLWNEGYNGTGTTVAVLDSGAWADHPDLKDRIIGFEDYVNGLSDLDPSDGIDAYDDNGHGTATAWLVAGSGEANGVFRGIAPGADLLIVKILDSDGTTDDSVIAQGVEFAVDQGVDVISLSVGGPWEDTSFKQPSIEACNAAVEEGVAVVVAAGNSGPAANTVNAPGVAEEVITVGASSGLEGVVAFSSRGPVIRTRTNPMGVFPKPDVVAPGYEVFSGRWKDASTYEYPVYNSSQFGSLYTRWSGTSAATPQVAGLVALLRNKHIGLPPLAAKAFLMAGATDLGQDSMAQGMGVANVSNASELITQTSRVVAVMAPLRYPTLPQGTNVFIVGEERQPQNVTVISTANFGTASINLAGNASQFVNVSTSSIDVAVGYTYFGINLDVPEDLPLSAIGYYDGNVTLVQGGKVLARMELELSITPFGGRLLVDMSHHSAEDPDDPSYYSYFKEYLRGQGVTTAWLGTPENTVLVDSDSLSDAEVFMIMDTEITYAETEIEAIHKFVEDGGTLVMLSEFYDDSTHTASFAIDSYNEILEPYGIQCERYGIGTGIGPDTGVVYGEGYGGIVENDTLTEGVHRLYILQGSTLRVDTSVADARGLFWIDSQKEHAIVATAQYGRGKVIVISDGSTLYDTTLYDAIKADADNLRLLRNLAAYIVPAVPRIYDVRLEAGHIGETANLTAFIFDEDLDSVRIVVGTPNGSSFEVTPTATLGYKFATSFTLESAGFYNISILATDEEGNVRVFQKTLLIPVRAVDDVFITTVVDSLLIVVVVGIAYVLMIKFRAKRPRKRGGEPEWEIPVTDGGTPPEIV